MGNRKTIYYTLVIALVALLGSILIFRPNGFFHQDFEWTAEDTETFYTYLDTPVFRLKDVEYDSCRLTWIMERKKIDCAYDVSKLHATSANLRKLRLSSKDLRISRSTYTGSADQRELALRYGLTNSQAQQALNFTTISTLPIEFELNEPLAEIHLLDVELSTSKEVSQYFENSDDEVSTYSTYCNIPSRKSTGGMLDLRILPEGEAAILELFSRLKKECN